jgi:hypothetical protein
MITNEEWKARTINKAQITKALKAYNKAHTAWVNAHSYGIGDDATTYAAMKKAEARLLDLQQVFPRREF